MTQFQGKMLVPGLTVLVIGSILGYILFPVLDVSSLLLGILAKEITSYLLLQLLVSSILLTLVILVLTLIYSYYLRSKFNYKRIYRFGVYWHKTKPYCPRCGGELHETAFDYMKCGSCEENIYLSDDSNKSVKKYKDIIDIIRKET